MFLYVKKHKTYGPQDHSVTIDTGICKQGLMSVIFKLRERLRQDFTASASLDLGAGSLCHRGIVIWYVAATAGSQHLAAIAHPTALPSHSVRSPLPPDWSSGSSSWTWLDGPLGEVPLSAAPRGALSALSLWLWQQGTLGLKVMTGALPWNPCISSGVWSAPWGTPDNLDLGEVGFSSEN